MAEGTRAAEEVNQRDTASMTAKLPTSNQAEPNASPNGSASRITNIAQKRRRSWIGFVRELSAYLFVYVMITGISIGPLFWVWFGAMYADGPKWIARLYLPLAYFCEICPPLRWLVNEWINWWIL
jgi:hypothetical protein